MGFFTTKTGDCKNRCDADLGWNKDAKKACREACKGDHTLDPWTWMDGLPTNIQLLYNYEANQVVRLEEQATRLSEPSTINFSTGGESSSSSPSIGLILVAAVAIIAAVLIIKRKK